MTGVALIRKMSKNVAVQLRTFAPHLRGCCYMLLCMSNRRLNGAAVKALREALGISLRGMARDIDRDPGFISRVERGLDHASPTTQVAIAKRLGVPLDAVTSVTEEAA